MIDHRKAHAHGNQNQQSTKQGKQLRQPNGRICKKRKKLRSDISRFVPRSILHSARSAHFDWICFQTVDFCHGMFVIPHL
ncbi:MAG: hypothetical protein MJK04_33465, partial [Psychrosphaera sp.]|nr:hypothetical protein [Psychrosphaera sp.]